MRRFLPIFLVTILILSLYGTFVIGRDSYLHYTDAANGDAEAVFLVILAGTVYWVVAVIFFLRTRVKKSIYFFVGTSMAFVTLMVIARESTFYSMPMAHIFDIGTNLMLEGLIISGLIRDMIDIQRDDVSNTPPNIVDSYSISEGKIRR